MGDNGETEFKKKFLQLEAENALLKAQLGNMATKDISLTSSDVSHQTTPRIAKPPNYNDGDSEEDDDNLDEPRPPPDGHLKTKTILNEHQSTKQEDADDEGVENKISSGVDNVIDLDNATVHDGGEKETPEPAKKPDEEDDIKEGDGNGATKEDHKSRDHQGSWVLLNQDGEKLKDMADGKFDVDDVTELVDRVESGVEATSKDEPGAFDGLVETLRVFLPLVLFMADEHKMLRDTKKDLLIRNRSLMKANHQARIEAEKRLIVETKSVGTSAEKTDDNETVCNGDSKCKESNQNDEDHNKGLEMEAMKRETKKLRLQCKELQHVNLSWEKYSQKKSSRYETEVKKLSMKLASSEEKTRKVEKRLDDKFRQYDQTLIEVKRSEERQKTISAQYKKDRDSVRAKNEEMKRHVKEQDEEIKRLNEVIQRKGTAKVYMKPAAFVVTQQARIIDDKYINVARKKSDHNEKQGAVAPPVATAVEPPVNREKSKAKDGKSAKNKQVSPPLSPRDPPGYGAESNPMSLTRDELKDQVVLFKEQIDVYRSDFNQERRDREKAVGQVDSLKKELEKTKKKVKEMQRHRMQKEHDLYVAARVGGQMHFLPEDTQEMRLREIKQQTRGKGKYPAYGRDYAEANLDATEGDFDLPEEHFYAEIN